MSYKTLEWFFLSRGLVDIENRNLIDYSLRHDHGYDNCLIKRGFSNGTWEVDLQVVHFNEKPFAKFVWK
jgi:hypothetical protein